MRHTTCRSCGAPVTFVPSSASSRTAILDRHPDPDGNVVLETDLLGNPVATTLPAHAATAAADRGETLYLSHFATCPNATQHRRRGA